MTEKIVSAIRDRLRQAKKIMVAAHVRPDGDAVGSVLGLGLALEAAGKQVQMILADSVPKDFSFLEGSDRIKTKRSEKVDTVIVLDTADRGRAGRALDGIETVDINIDHHITNTNYADLNLIVEAVSTTQILTDLISQLELPVTPGMNEALLAGLIADSQGFRTQNMEPNALRAAADLVEAGANLPEIYFKVLTRKSFKAARYWGAGLSHIQCQNGIVWTTLSLEDRKAADYPGRDDADLVNFLSRIDDANVAVLIIEQNKNKVKVSWRSKGGFDVTKVAGIFGGGGHVAAAGAMIEGKLEEVSRQVIVETQKTLIK